MTPERRAEIVDPNRFEHVVYYLRDADGQVLYVGLTINPTHRIQRHKSTNYGHRIAAVEFEGPYNFRTGRDVERAAIARLQPPLNAEWTERAQLPWKRQSAPTISIHEGANS